MNNSGWFPHSWDGAIPPVPETPDNPPNALKLSDYTQPIDTSALYYGLGCDVRIRAPVLNAIISELMSVLEFAAVRYSSARLFNLREAIVRLIQSGGAQWPHGHSGFAQIPLKGDAVSLKAELFTLHSEVDTLKKEVAALKVSNSILCNQLKEKVPT